MGEWDDINGRLMIKKAFLKVKKDPFGPSDDLTNLHVLRIEVYPQTQYDKYFSLNLKKRDQLIRKETGVLDERGKLKIISGAAAGPVILRSYFRTHIPRRLEP